MNTGKVVLGMVAGAAVGAALGILLAPDKGSTTRNQISKRSKGLAGNLKTKFEEFIFSLLTTLGNANNEAEELLDKGKEKFQQVKSDVSPTSDSY